VKSVGFCPLGMCNRGLIFSGHFADRQDKLVSSTFFVGCEVGTSVGEGGCFSPIERRNFGAVIPQYEACSARLSMDH